MISVPKGTKDVLPNDSHKWHFIEEKVREVANVFGLKEIRTPTFEHTELFLRGVGQTTDIVNKEMYTFIDKGGRSITLKPEGTAGVARAYIENNLSQLNMPLKMYYLSPVFRYERPQAGRLREHHQFGVEIFGSTSFLTDVETILIAKSLLNKIGITELELNINSIGCSDCRQVYNKELVKYLEKNKDELCPLCIERLYKNPLRVLDCKQEKCTLVNKNAPKTLDYLCNDCDTHHKSIVLALTELGINFKVNPNIVRGLDYYTKTVFEFISTSIGAQGTVCGGGRYNGLIEEVGGKPTPAVGFGMGLERLIMVAESLGVEIPDEKKPYIYIANMEPNLQKHCFMLANKLRDNGIYAISDLTDRSFKSQLKHADKMGCKLVAIVGENEIKSKGVTVKNMQTGEQKEVGESCLIDYFNCNSQLN